MEPLPEFNSSPGDVSDLDGSASSRTRRVRLTLAAILLAASLLGLTWIRGQIARRESGKGHVPATASQEPLRRPPRGEREPSSFVGDAACVDCHAEITRSFANHPMGRSLAPVAGYVPDGLLPFQREASFRENDVTYAVRPNGARLTHAETLADDGQRPILTNEATVEFAVGSGQQGVSFLFQRGDGYLFASPLCWFPREHGWDIAPGYRKGTPHFERPVREGCVYCHANRFDLVEGTQNRYRTPLFRGHAIGCERCHGAGSSHLKQPVPSSGDPPNIVNPASLAPSLREAVCQQCHLQAEVRILRAGRRWTDYRPGEPLHETIDVYLRAGHILENRFIGQVEQMYASRCFLGSGGALGCISCHDPHVRPEPAVRDFTYRARCLACHADDDGDGDPPIPLQATSRGDSPRAGTSMPCSLPRVERLKQSPIDSCTTCHMPPLDNRRIAHTSTTDHRIPRRPGAPATLTSKSPEASWPTGPSELISFFRDLREADRRAGRELPGEQERDLGVALSIDPPAPMSGDSAASAPGESDRLALDLLRTSLERSPNDLDALYALGLGLQRQGRDRQALESFQNGLQLQPENEELLFQAAGAAVRLSDLAQAAPLLDRLIRINPHRADYFNLVASARTMARDWEGAEAACRSSLSLNAFDAETRLMLVQALLQRHDPRADGEFETLVRSDPAKAVFYREWFSRYRSR